MRRLFNIIVILSILVSGIVSFARAQMATKQEINTIAKNWISMIIQKQGNWGGAEFAFPGAVHEFTRGKRVLGYFCQVTPAGFMIFSLRKELAPIKAYSTRVDLNPDSNEEYVEVIKNRMEQILDAIEQKIGSVRLARIEDLSSMLDTDHRTSWDELLGVANFTNYQQRQLPIYSIWEQEDPYNRQCPMVGGSRAVVGCVATAASQIMHYWSWPPYGEGSLYNDMYDWKNMPDTLTASCPNEQINAVAELCYETGKAAGTDYGASESSAWLGNKIGSDMTDAFRDNFRYNQNTDFEQRWHYSSDSDWFNIIKDNIDANQPLQYGILDLSIGDGFAGHSMVCDGYEIAGSMHYFHMNYGWGYTCTWDDITNIAGAEGVIRKIRPEPSIGSWIESGWHSTPDFPYRYFNRDATGHDATFDAGHYFQFLPGVSVKCTSPTDGKIQFRGWSDNNTILFTRGDRWSKGIRIFSGIINLYQNGSIFFY